LLLLCCCYCYFILFHIQLILSLFAMTSS
jgi:hypothetical protein